MSSTRLPRTIRLQLADNHDIVRAGLRRLVEDYPDIRVVAESNCGRSAIRDYFRHKPDVLILDISMPDISGFEVIRRILPEAPDARILVLSFHENKLIPDRALQLGAAGYLTKGSSPSLLIKGIRQVHSGGTYVEPGIAQKLAVSGRARSHEDLSVLSPRELEVLLLAAEGKSTAVIARRLSISPKTVGNHYYNIMQKLGLSNRAELVRLAIQLGLISA